MNILLKMKIKKIEEVSTYNYNVIEKRKKK